MNFTFGVRYNSDKKVQPFCSYALGILFFFLQTGVLRAQSTKPLYDSNYRPGTYELKSNQFRVFPTKSTDVVFLGNSITAGVDWTELLQLPQAKNRGISGDITFGVLDRLEEIIEGKPQALFLLIGINDISRNIPDSLIIRNHRKIVERMQSGSPKTKIYLQSILPVNNQIPPVKNHYNKDEHIAIVNVALQALAKEKGCVYIDLHPVFADQDGRLRKELTYDGLHLNIQGYMAWAEHLRTYLNLPAVAYKKNTTMLSKHEAHQQMPFPVFTTEGHRGARGLMPENTIPAMKKALELGVTTLEMDVVISKDKKVVVSHDTYFHHDITRTPEGKTLTKEEGFSRTLYAMNYDSIKKYDVGMKPHPGFPQQKKMKVVKPLLEELIETSEAYAKKLKRAAPYYNIETKTQKGKDGVHHPLPEEFVDLLVDVLTKKGIVNRTVVQSFDIRTIQYIHKKYPNIRTSYLVDAKEKKTLEAQLQSLGFLPFIYSPQSTIVTPELIKACHDLGIKVIPWTVNDLESMKRLKAMGVDGIISDYPDLFKQLK